MIKMSAPDVGMLERSNLLHAFDSGWLTHRGQFVEQFEKGFISWLDPWSNQDNWLEALACSSGTTAMHLALLACGVGWGDKVIVPDICFPTIASVVKHMGARLVIVDVGKDHLMEPEAVANIIDDKTKAVIAVDLYGENADALGALSFICKNQKVPLIQDACESLGFVTPYGDYVTYSFFANKVMTTGEGGMLLGKDLDLARSYRDGGWDKDYKMTLPGLNYRMTNLQAAIGCAQLTRLPEMLARYRHHESQYATHLNGYGKWMFVMNCKYPLIFKERLERKGIESRPVFYPLHMQEPFKKRGRFRNAVDTWSHGLCLPTGTHLIDDDVQFIIDNVKEIQCDHSESL